ncbi:hypothetical protein BBJ28_00009635 [Nothophytophthora sp. Chile5]|nr:hypothetical protein BBJ28_00009633 [Nothophytophthora sp. Chile5]RLN06361.1 hypothetical protein BBJ28_00009635 [Nothophytophthora sp. Chile5]
MNTHTRFALPINTPANLKYLHDKAQANEDCASASASAPMARRDSSGAKFSQKMKGLFPGKQAKAEPTLSEEALEERKRTTMRQVVGSHAFVQMGRR